MAVGDIYRCEVHYQLGSTETMNVLHMKEKVACTDDIPARSVAKALRDAWAALYNTALFSDVATMFMLRVRRIKPTTGIPSTFILGAGAEPIVTGNDPSAPVPSQAALLISLYSDTLNAHGRGRIYVPGVARASQNDGRLTAAAIALANAAAGVLEATMVAVAGDTGEWNFAVYSRSLGTADDVESAQAHTNLATQRSRRAFPGVGAP
jgi:hypothetical protein